LLAIHKGRRTSNSTEDKPTTFSGSNSFKIFFPGSACRLVVVPGQQQFPSKLAKWQAFV
jgi:hypothetical protein